VFVALVAAEGPTAAVAVVVLGAELLWHRQRTMMRRWHWTTTNRSQQSLAFPAPGRQRTAFPHGSRFVRCPRQSSDLAQCLRRQCPVLRGVSDERLRERKKKGGRARYILKLETHIQKLVLSIVFIVVHNAERVKVIDDRWWFGATAV